MEISLKISEQIDPIAAIALVLTLSQLIIGIIAWWLNRKKILLHVSPNMVFIGGDTTDKNTYVFLRITNIGDKPINLRSITMEFWPSYYRKLLKKQRSSYYVNVINYTGRSNVPALIEIGHDWGGFIIQTSQMEKMMDGYLEIQANHSLSVKPVVKRIVRSKGDKIKSN